jgi:hypothetical protein
MTGLTEMRLGVHTTSVADAQHCSPHLVPCTWVLSYYCCAPAAGLAAAAAVPAAPAVPVLAAAQPAAAVVAALC